MLAPSRLKDRSGRGKIALLLWLILLGALGYCAFGFGGVYWRKYRLEETITRDLSSAGQLVDETIGQSVSQHVSEMNLPIASGGFRFARTESPRGLRVMISYVETVNLVFAEIEIPVSLDFFRPF